MIPSYTLLFPLIAAIQWRFARGEGKWRRWQFYLLMFGLAFLASFDVVLSAGFLLFVVGLAMPPHNALFCALTGRPPGRPDHWLWQWMQDAALWVTARSCSMGQKTPRFWYLYGIVYGAIRAVCMLPGILFLAGYTGSLLPLTGLVFFAEGYAYYLARKVSLRFALAEDKAVPIAEVFIGWAAMTYGLACAGAL